MDIDRFVALNQPLWERLGALSKRGSSGLRSMPASEIDELVRLYQRSSTHLSYARTYYRDPALVAQLTGLVATAGALVYGTRPRSLRGLASFFLTTFPAALWHSRRFVAVAAVLLFAPMAGTIAWLATSDRALDAAAPEALRAAYLEEDFEAYYSSEPASEFAAKVTTNNIQVGFFAFASGIGLCVPTALLLAYNGANVGVAGGLFTAAGEAGRFYGLILPHGLLELTAVVVAGSSGLALGWALVDPRGRTRRDALAEEGGRAVVIVLGLVAVFAAAGLIEGFVTGSGLPTWLRVGIGVVAEAAFVGYAVSFGRTAAGAGYTGRFGEERDRLAAQSRPVALTRR
ncbi:MAG TPA: stage II sporulation protein M [Acidimicrobiales bacterium]|nr:stage II sporulation protein M [Acidimicrobiales bacterium]